MSINKKDCVVCDVDGVLLDSSWIIREIYEKGLKGDTKWDYFYSKCNSEKVMPIAWAKKYLELAVLNGILPLLLTARNEHNRAETEKKLKKENIPYFKMYMRQEGDYRTSSEVKEDWLKEISNEYNIIIFIDDDLSNIRVAQKMNLNVFKVSGKGECNENISN